MLCLGLLAGCATEPVAGPGSEAGQATGPARSDSEQEVWSARPVSVRIYPSTRFVLERDRPILEARIELFDQMGDPMKQSGQVRCELYAVSDESTGPGTLVHRWDVVMSTLEDQRLYYDPITRGYVYRLVIDEVGIARRPTRLQVVFETPDGRRLSTAAMIETGD